MQKKQQNKQVRMVNMTDYEKMQEISSKVSGKIITCTENRVENGNLTLRKQYEIIYAYKDSYCIIDDSDELEVYNKCFFEKAKNDK